MFLRPSNLCGAGLLLLATMLSCAQLEDVSDDSDFYNMCQENSDCLVDLGQVCGNGLCLGGDDTIGERFGALLIPPPGSTELAPTEISSLTVSKNGEIEDLAFTDTINVRAHLQIDCGTTSAMPSQCGPEAPVRATISIIADSNIRGASPYQLTVLSENTEGPSIVEFRLPRDGRDYEIIILPETSQSDDNDTIVAAPPLRELISSEDDVDTIWLIGQEDTLKEAEGCVTNELGQGQQFAGLKVGAWGKWRHVLDDLERASATVFTDEDGCYSFKLPINMLDEFDIVITPEPDQDIPEIRLRKEFILDPTTTPAVVHTVAPIVVPTIGSRSNKTIRVLHIQNGETNALAGATIGFETFFAPLPTETRDLIFSHSTQVVTPASDEAPNGETTTSLYSGTNSNPRTYNLDVVSPSDSSFESLFGARVDVTSSSALEDIVLDERKALSGLVVDDSFTPVPDTAVSVNFDPVFRSSLQNTEQQLELDKILLPTVTTGEDGGFTLFLDDQLGQIEPTYGLAFAPPRLSLSPATSSSSLSVQDLGITERTFALPEAIHLRGSILDANGQRVELAEIRFFELPAIEDCPDHLQECLKPASQRSSVQSNAIGNINTTLPWTTP